MAFHFEPVALDMAQEGQYLFFEWLGPTLLDQMPRAIHLDHIKARLLYCLAARLAGDPSPSAIARRFCGKEDVETVRKRYARLMVYVSSFNGSEKRVNGIVSTCLEHLAKHTDLVATLFDAPIWEMVSRGYWPLRELEAFRNRVESMGIDIPYDPTNELDACCFFFSLCKPQGPGESIIWAAVNAAAFCMVRAQAVGDLVTYGVAYDAMISHARESQLADDTDLLTHMLRDFWAMFVRFVRLWHSRVRLTDLTAYDRQGLSKSLQAHTVEAYWQVIPNLALLHGTVPPRVIARGDSQILCSGQSTRAHRWALRFRLWRIFRSRSHFLKPRRVRKLTAKAVRYRKIEWDVDPQTLLMSVERSDQEC
ncbi:hypothetical protein B0G81_3874 [Paraburkholderia sp. BL6665CI2N2]|uniref:hypothetical protein n=1 Tax=Paraburkholderia sp. BL6665CI2N2 TaxID=1938806 RepID=UPI001064CBCC|nr:hypothetical protein [Paraburkholderia sp. BL6665CI2N2]TDY23499.1 hypothetical protein B0G81_3874 [Paraburkholderia sp. BL6665CI2N2]